MSDFFDDDPDFWNGQRAEPTIQIERVRRRTPERTRSHGVVRKDAAAPSSQRIDLREADEAADFESMWVEPSRPGWTRSGRSLGVLGNVDPRLLSVGAVTLAVVLAVPLFGSLTKDDGAETFRTVAQATSTTTSTVPEMTTTTVVVVRADNTPVANDPPSRQDVSHADESSDSDESSTASSGNAAGFQSANDDDDSPTDVTVLAAPSVRSAAQCGNPYEVQAGDFWVMLADAVGMSVDEFLEYNEADVDTPLYPGDTICLPLGESVVPETTAPPATEAPATAAPTTVAPVTEAPTTAAPSTDAPTTTDPPGPATTQAPATTQPADDDDDGDGGGIALPTNPAPSGGQVEAMIREIWPDDLEEQALRIAWRESNYRPDVTSSIGCCHGVFQIHEQHLSWLSGYGITSVSHLFDARTNIQAAYYLYQRSGGWGPWQ